MTDKEVLSLARRWMKDGDYCMAVAALMWLLSDEEKAKVKRGLASTEPAVLTLLGRGPDLCRAWRGGEV